jgi:putative PIN family toxin of toxin-antitoxin system
MTSQFISKPKLRIIPDTSFLLAAVLKDGYARSYLIGRGSKFLSYQLYTSESILLEFQNKLENTFGFDRPQVVRAITDLRRIIKIVHPSQKVTVVRDPDDNKIIECAIEADADLIVSFDKDLLVIKEYKKIKIIHPRMLKYLFPN